MVVTQLWLVLSGNFAWLNWVTIALAMSAAAPLWARPAPPLPAPPVWFEVLALLATAGVLALSYR